MRKLVKTIFSINFLYLVLIAAQVAAIIFLCLTLPSVLPLALAFAVVWLLNAIAACVLFSRKGAPEVKCAWFVLITALPVAGALIYFFATFKIQPCGGALKVTAQECDSANLPQTDLLKSLAPAAQKTCGTGLAGYEKAEYFADGAEFFSSVCREIERAKRSVFVEFFIIGRGKIFNSFITAVQKARENGAEVRLLIDGVGSAFKISRKDLKRLKSNGVKVKIFHRLTPLPRASLNLRDHRKIITVDGEVAFTGGFNLADEYANITSPYGYWKDTGLAVYGGAAKVFEGMFLSVWDGGCTVNLPADGRFFCLPYYDSPPHKGFFEDAFVCAVNNAKERVYITTPYFCGSAKVISALEFAAKRGVDVKIILPHIPDKKYAFGLSKAFAHEVAKSGVKVFEFTPGFMHAKCVICDGTVFLGSYNLD
ncbi:MAG: PLDc N-terminal domain-containing protein, partial [Clostridia bacterium]|nr:PLDc N-terminal domain-containing protein [Clostridia bacterium]